MHTSAAYSTTADH